MLSERLKLARKRSGLSLRAIVLSRRRHSVCSGNSASTNEERWCRVQTWLSPWPELWRCR